MTESPVHQQIKAESSSKCRLPPYSTASICTCSWSPCIVPPKTMQNRFNIYNYFSTQRRLQATGFGVGDVNVPVNLLTSCMLRELRGWLGYIYMYVCQHMYTYTFVFTVIYINMYISSFTYVYKYIYIFLTYVHTYIYIYV